MKEPEYIQFKNREEFRTWLTKNHDINTGIWIVFYRKHTRREGITYNEVLEEALCFGWIDSLIKKIDDDSYARKVSLRTNTKKWSEINKKKVRELLRANKMTQAGLNKIDRYAESGQVVWKDNKSELKGIIVSGMPEFIHEAFEKNEPALINFENHPQTYKRHYLLWITSARKEETVKKRLEESIELLKENRKLGLRYDS